MKPKVTAALIGISGYGDIYLESLLDDPRNASMDLVAAADPAPHRSKHLGELQKRGVRIFPSLSSLLDASPVDMVMLATPIHLHAAQMCLAVERGSHVLCEKPLAGSSIDAARMLACERSTSRMIAIGFQWSFSNAIQALKRDIMAGEFGRPLQLKSLVSFPRGHGYFSRNDWAGRIRNDAGLGILDSPVNNAAAHYLHNMLYLLGRTRETSAMPISIQAELYRANPVENYDTAMLRCQTDVGAEVLFYTTHAMAERVGPVAVYEFEKATVHYDFVNASTFTAHFRDGRTRSYGDPNVDRHLKIWRMIDSIHSGEKPACSVIGAVPHMLCALHAQRSMPDGVENFPASLLSREQIDQDEMVVVTGLNNVMRDCFERAILPSELKIAWSRTARVVLIDGLDSLHEQAPPHVSVQVRTRAAAPASVIGPAGV
jgi:predicted dehydrogenase